MGIINPEPIWHENIYLIDVDDEVKGGEPVFSGNQAIDGYANAAPKQLADNILYLRENAVRGEIERVTLLAADGDFIPGATTQVSLTVDPVAKENIDVFFDDLYQQQTEYSLAGLNVVFNNPIPVGVAQVEISYGYVVPYSGLAPAVEQAREAADSAQASAELAEESANSAVIASELALTQGNVFDSIADGLAGTSDGEVFTVYPDGPDNLTGASVFRNETGVAELLWVVLDSRVFYDIFETQELSFYDMPDDTDFVWAIRGNNNLAPLGLLSDGTTRATKVRADLVNNIGIEDLSDWSGFIFAIRGSDNNSVFALTEEGIKTTGINSLNLSTEVVNTVDLQTQNINGIPFSDLFNSDPNIFVPRCTQEWWIGPVHTFVSAPYPRIVSGNYSEAGEIVVSETLVGQGTIRSYVLGSTPKIDDHNAPSLWAENGRRMLVTWTRHNQDNLIRARVSDTGGDIKSFLDLPEIAIDVGFSVTYTQIFKIRHLSTESNDVFWIFARNVGSSWGFVEVQVDQVTGVVSRTSRDWVNLFTITNNQAYTSVAEAYTPEGQVLRMAIGCNPAAPDNRVWYMEINAVTGSVYLFGSPSWSSTANIDGTGIPAILNGRVPALPAAQEGYDRRLHYVRPGPIGPAILYAEWPLTDPTQARYYVATLDQDSWVSRDHGPSGSKIGYTDGANYIAGASFPAPCFSDVVFAGRYDDDNGVGYLLEQRFQSGSLVETIIDQTDGSRVVRPISPVNAGYLVTYSNITWYSPTNFRFEGDLKSAIRK